MNFIPNGPFNKVLIIEESDGWMVALCRSGHATQEDAMQWALDYLQLERDKEILGNIYGDAINKAFENNEQQE